MCIKKTKHTKGSNVSKSVTDRKEYARLQSIGLKKGLEQLDTMLECLLLLAAQEDMEQCNSRDTGASDSWEHRIMRVRYVLAFD